MNITASIDDIYHTIARLRDCQTSYDIFHVFKDVCQKYNFNFFMVAHLPSSLKRSLYDLTLITNWDPELIKAYDTKAFYDSSPIIETLRRSSKPFFWNSAKTKNAKSNEIQKFFRSFGHENGVHFPVTDNTGSRGSVAFSGVRDALKNEELLELSFFSIQAYDRLHEILAPLSKLLGELTRRELECVKWSAAGKTSSEVAIIIGISENTVNHYLTNVANKLNTVNKTHSVAKAIQLGLLSS